MAADFGNFIPKTQTGQNKTTGLVCQDFFGVIADMINIP